MHPHPAPRPPRARLKPAFAVPRLAVYLLATAALMNLILGSVGYHIGA